jgi:hypothetical protein
MLLSYTGARCCGTVPFRRERRPHLGFRPEQIIQILAISPAALLFALSLVPDRFDLLEKLLRFPVILFQQFQSVHTSIPLFN